MARSPAPSTSHPGESDSPGLSRRSFLKGAGGVAAGGMLAGELEARPPAVEVLEGEIVVELSINGDLRKLRVEPRTTLLDALRIHADPPLTGAKPVCERGNCGACTVLVDERPAYACLLLAADLEGRAITTVEGLGTPDELSPVQSAFCAEDASMCGFCTPGFVVSVTACLRRNPAAQLDEIKRACSGNLCRCGTYPHVFAAALAAGRELRSNGRRPDAR